jgi:hypothetical protein
MHGWGHSQAQGTNALKLTQLALEHLECIALGIFEVDALRTALHMMQASRNKATV